MNDALIVAAYVVIDETMAAFGHADHALARVRDAEVLAVAVVASKCFANNHERALGMMHGMRYLTKPLSTSCFNRRLHARGGWPGLILETLGELFAEGEAFLIDSMPIPVCRRARRSRKLHGKAFCGYCAAKKEKFFGWRRHLVCTTAEVPVAFNLVPGGLHELMPIHELTYGLPGGAAVYGDKAYTASDAAATIVADTRVRLVPRHKANMRPNDWADKLALRAYRKCIETQCIAN